MAVLRAGKWLGPADLHPVHAELLRRPRSLLLLPARALATPICERPSQAQEGCRVLHDDRLRSQGTGQNDVIAALAVAPVLRPRAHNSSVTHARLGDNSLEIRALAHVALDQPNLGARQRHREREAGKSRAGAEVRDRYSASDEDLLIEGDEGLAEPDSAPLQGDGNQ